MPKITSTNIYHSVLHRICKNLPKKNQFISHENEPISASIIALSLYAEIYNLDDLASNQCLDSCYKQVYKRLPIILLQMLLVIFEYYIVMSHKRNQQPDALLFPSDIYMCLDGGSTSLPRSLKGSLLKEYCIDGYDFGGDELDFQFVQYLHSGEIRQICSTNDTYIPFKFPLRYLVDWLTCEEIKQIAKLHGLSFRARDNKATLKSLFFEHNCLECEHYVSIFCCKDGSAIKKKQQRDWQHKSRLILKQSLMFNKKCKSFLLTHSHH